MLAFSTTAVSQAYWYLQSTGSDAGFENLYGGSTTTVLAAPSDDVLSTSQSLPFSWDFYGTAVTTYKASDNGYITFDGSATTSSPANSSLPGSVNAAIFVFWDDLQVQNTGSGSTDEVRSWTYGTSPNRTHVIQWFSCSVKAGGNSSNANWVYLALLIHEGGGFDIVHPGSNSISQGDATVGIQNGLGTDFNAVTGSPTIALPASLDYTDGTDDVVYSFKFGTQPAIDLSVITETSAGLAEPAGTGITLMGDIKNLGTTTITSMDMHYTINGGSQVDQSMSSISLTTGNSYSYSFTTQFTPATAGTNYAIEIWADNINGMVDEDLTNDRLNKSLIATLGVTTTRIPLAEEFTGAWCQFCPDGAVYMDLISSTHGNEVSIASIHSGDDMTITGYLDLTGRYSMTGWPGMMVDRTVWPGQSKAPLGARSDWQPTVSQALNVGGIATITFENLSYNGGTRALSVDVVTTFEDYTAGDIRVNLYITEAVVTGSGSGYDQVNYYNSQAGHQYYQAGSPIVGYEHKNVLRAAMPDFNGQAGVIPDPVAVGTKYSFNFTTTIPAGWDENELRLIGFASQYNPGVPDMDKVINSANVSMTGVTPGVDQNEVAVNELRVFPNPAKDISFVYFNLERPAKVEVSVYNVVGQKVETLRQGNFIAGQHRAAVDASSLQEGVYFITVKAGETETTTKLFVVK